MTNDEIIKLVKEAGPLISTPFDQWCERFAHLVRAQALEEAAEVCDEQAHNWHLHAKGGPVAVYNTCAGAIRALKEILK